MSSKFKLSGLYSSLFVIRFSLIFRTIFDGGGTEKSKTYKLVALIFERSYRRFIFHVCTFCGSVADSEVQSCQKVPKVNTIFPFFLRGFKFDIITSISVGPCKHRFMYSLNMVCRFRATMISMPLVRSILENI